MIAGVMMTEAISKEDSLNLFVPYVNATNNTDLGIYNLTTNGTICDKNGCIGLLNATSYWNRTGTTLEPATVCSNGCDYTSIVTAFSTEGANKRYYIKGTFSESSDVDIPEKARITWDDVIINLSDTKIVEFVGDNSTHTGKLKINGNGTNMRMLTLSGDGVYAKDLRIFIDCSETTLDNTMGGPIMVYINTDYSYYDIRLDDISFTMGGGAFQAVGFYMDGDHNRLILSVDGMTDTSGTSAGDVFGVELAGNSLYNTINVDIGAITIDDGNHGSGIVIGAGSNYNSVSGISVGSDESRVNDLGTGNEVGAIASN